jgi:AAA family ATP:ADP antiporter
VTDGRSAAAARPAAEEPGKRGPLEWLLALFADVRAGEGPTVLLLALNGFVLLTAYYIIKPVRESFILQGGPAQIFGVTVGKAELKSYASAGMAALLVLVVILYGKLASALARQRLITYVTLFFISNLVVFYFLAQGAIAPWLGITFFLWVGIFNVLVVAQFWAFANDIYVPDEGKRLFAIVGFGASFGAFLGAKIAEWLVKPVGESKLLLITGALLGLCIALTNIVHRREAGRRPARLAVVQGGATTAREAEKPMGKSGGFQLVFSERYLTLIAALAILANLVNTTGEYILSQKVTEAAAAVSSGATTAADQGKFIAQFYGRFFSIVNLLGLGIQLFLVSRILKYLGVRVALLVLPLIALGGYGAVALGATLGVVRIAKILENATDYSLQSTTKNALFLPTSREVKYKAKAALDTFFVRIGDFCSALLLFLGLRRLHLSTERFALLNAALVLVWIVVAIAIVRRFQKLSASPQA